MPAIEVHVLVDRFLTIRLAQLHGSCFLLEAHERAMGLDPGGGEKGFPGCKWPLFR
jgi:hypothetical protein